MAKKPMPPAQDEPAIEAPTVAPVSPAPDGTEAYIVQDKAPSHVAGKRVTKGQTVFLTEDQARAELQQLHILPRDIATEAEPAADGA